MTTPDAIKGRPAIVNEPVGRGRILMFATNPVYRWQNFGEFRMLYNAILNYKQLDLGAPPAAAAAITAPTT